VTKWLWTDNQKRPNGGAQRHYPEAEIGPCYLVSLLIFLQNVAYHPMDGHGAHTLNEKFEKGVA
jgi:hypothetical protein